MKLGRPRPWGERLAALVAVLSMGGAMVLVIASALTDWRAVLVALSGLLVMVVGAWYVLSRRGRARSVALLAVAAGGGVLIAGFALADVSVLRIAAVVLLGCLSIGSARVALHRSPRKLRVAARTRAPAPPAQRGVLLINPGSGGGKAARFELVEECRGRGIESVVLRPGDDLEELAEQAVSRGADVLGMAGGDGSQALVASVAARHGLPHVIVPAGTRNHFALDMGLDRNDVVGALDAYRDGVERPIDLAAVNGRVFVNNATVGIYAKVVQSANYRQAKRATMAEVLPDLLGPEAGIMDLRFRGPDGTAFHRAQVILVSNNTYDLHGMTGRGTRERVDQGLLGIVAVRISDAAEFVRFLTLEATGRSRCYPGLVEWSAPRFRVDSGAPVEVGVDGEALILDPPLLFETWPQALRVRIPRRAIGRSPSARAVHLLSHGTVAQLARIVIGRGGGWRTSLAQRGGLADRPRV